jgi:hypothetical protein
MRIPLIISALFVSLTNLYADDIKCPDGGIMLEYRSPISGNNIKTCRIKKDGQMVQHGPTLEYDKMGNLVSNSNFVYGKKEPMARLFSGGKASKGERVEGLKDSGWRYGTSMSSICGLSKSGKLSCFSRYALSSESLGKVSIGHVDGVVTDFIEARLHCILVDNTRIFCRPDADINKRRNGGRVPEFTQFWVFDKKIRKVGISVLVFCFLDEKDVLICMPARTDGHQLLGHNDKRFNVNFQVPGEKIDSFIVTSLRNEGEIICIITDTKKIYCKDWIEGHKGPLVIESKDWLNKGIKTVKYSFRHGAGCFLDNNGSTYCTRAKLLKGHDRAKRLIFPGPSKVKLAGESKDLIVATRDFACSLLTDGRVQCYDPLYNKLEPIKFLNRAGSPPANTSSYALAFPEDTESVIGGHTFICGVIGPGEMICYKYWGPKKDIVWKGNLKF